ncbi:hypothetical protein MTO96_015625 [Rhipicephalus appendiculatus]
MGTRATRASITLYTIETSVTPAFSDALGWHRAVTGDVGRRAACVITAFELAELNGRPLGIKTQREESALLAGGVGVGETCSSSASPQVVAVHDAGKAAKLAQRDRPYDSFYRCVRGERASAVRYEVRLRCDDGELVAIHDAMYASEPPPDAPPARPGCGPIFETTQDGATVTSTSTAPSPCEQDLRLAINSRLAGEKYACMCV